MRKCVWFHRIIINFKTFDWFSVKFLKFSINLLQKVNIFWKLRIKVVNSFMSQCSLLKFTFIYKFIIFVNRIFKINKIMRRRLYYSGEVVAHMKNNFLMFFFIFLARIKLKYIFTMYTYAKFVINFILSNKYYIIGLCCLWEH